MDLTILICTYNRAQSLLSLLASVERQVGTEDITFEVLIVDNNSTDDTRAMADSMRARASFQLRYILEPRQGKSYALNRGLASAVGDIVAVTDDDQQMTPTYVRDLVGAFRQNPDVGFIGGKVLPIWEESPPVWLTPKHWTPLGMLDHGDEPFVVDRNRPVCLLTCAFRRADLVAVGGYREDLGLTANSIGGTEDADVLERLWLRGRHGMYLPTLCLMHHAPANRLSRSYHRRWHRGHGSYQSLRRSPDVERSQGSLFGVPTHLYRQAVADSVRYLGAILRQDPIQFHLENQLWFFIGFFQQRYSDHRSAGQRSKPREILRVLRNFLARIRSGARLGR